MLVHFNDILPSHRTKMDFHINPAGTNQSFVQLLGVVGGDDQHPPLHLHHSVQDLQQGRQGQLLNSEFLVVGQRVLQQPQEVHVEAGVIFVAVLVLLLLLVFVLVASLPHGVLQVGRVNVLQDVESLVERDVFIVDVGV